MVRLRVRVALAGALAWGLLTFSPALINPAWAQQDVRDLVDRVDRLEHDLNVLQSQVYRNPGGTQVITSPAAGGGALGGGALGGGAYSSLDQRISALEDAIAKLTDRIEVGNHATQELSAKLDRAQADDDVRLKALEQKGGGAPPGAPGTPAPVANNAPPPPPGGPAQLTPNGGAAPAGSGGDSDSPTMGSAPHPLGQISQSDLKKFAPPANASAPTASPQDLYDQAFAKLRNADYQNADAAFQAFLAQYPTDPLAGNAQYWRGQIAFAQGKYDAAAPLFFDAYQKYPKSAKASESLLKLGMAMNQLGKKKEACAAFDRFNSEYPDAGESLRRTQTAERQKAGC
jgi:tol-pal system protein YbgF